MRGSIASCDSARESTDGESVGDPSFGSDLEYLDKDTELLYLRDYGPKTGRCPEIAPAGITRRYSNVTSGIGRDRSSAARTSAATRYTACTNLP